MFNHTDGAQTISHKEDHKKIEALFTHVVPDYDTARVHASDMRKIIQWFNTLVAAGMTEFKLPEEAAGEAEATEAGEATTASATTAATAATAG
jgi:hypothetical protein